MAENIQDFIFSENGTNVQPPDEVRSSGWLAGEQPPAEYMSWLQNYITKAIAFFTTNAISKWESSRLYDTDAVIKYNGIQYISLIDSNLNINPESNSASWRITDGSDRLKKSGDTAVGHIKGITPVSPEDLTRKDYVDAGVNSKPTGSWTWNGTTFNVTSN